MIKTKWFIYTVIIGLVPIAIRLFIYLVTNKVEWHYVLNEVDLVFFGLVLHISNINELEGKNFDDKKWKSRNIGLSVIMLVFLSALLMLSYFSEFDINKVIEKNNLKILASFLSISSFLSSYSIFNRLNTLNNV